MTPYTYKEFTHKALYLLYLNPIKARQEKGFSEVESERFILYLLSTSLYPAISIR